jgi:spermidine synthase
MPFLLIANYKLLKRDEKKYSGQFSNSALSLSKDNSSAAIIGGGDGGVARECLSKGFDLIDWYELDPEVVKVCQKHLPKICGEVKANNNVKTYWGDAFESIKKVKDSKYDKIFIDLNDDQFCIDLAAKNMKGLKRILKPGGVITAQVGCLSKKPKQIKNWMGVLENSFGNVELSETFIP